MKTIKTILIENNRVFVNYIDDIGNIQTFMSSADTSNYIASIQNELNILPKANATVKYVSLLNNVFNITGDYYPPKFQDINNLTVDQKQIVDNLSNFINSYSGQPLLSLLGEIGQHKVTINGIYYAGDDYNNLVTADTSNTIYNAIILSIQLFNS